MKLYHVYLLFKVIEFVCSITIQERFILINPNLTEKLQKKHKINELELESYIEYANYIKLMKSSDENSIEIWVYSKSEITSDSILLFDEDSKDVKYTITFSKLKAVGEILFPTISNYSEYYSEVNNNLIWTYNDYSQQLQSFVTTYMNEYNTVDLCRILDDYLLTSTNLTIGKRNLYILCFLNLNVLTNYLSNAVTKYIDYMEKTNIELINYIEMGRSLGIYMLKEGSKEVKIFNIRLLSDSIAIYYHNSDTDEFCLEEGFKYFEIIDCVIRYKSKIFATDPYIDESCCISYKRVLTGGLFFEETICSFRQSVEVCIMEIRQIQKHLTYGCLSFKESMTNDDIETFSPNIRDIEKEIKREDIYLKNLLGTSLPENQIIKVCNDNSQKEGNYKNPNNFTLINKNQNNTDFLKKH